MEEIEKIKMEIEKRVIHGRALEEECTKYWYVTRKMQQDLWLLENGYAIGDDVEILDGNKWVKCQLTGMKIWLEDEARPILTAYKKDGTLGSRTPYIGWKPQIRKVGSVENNSL